MSTHTKALGPYAVQTFESRESQSYSRHVGRYACSVVGPEYAGPWMSYADAERLMGQMNAAFAAGAASQPNMDGVREALEKLATISEDRHIGHVSLSTLLFVVETTAKTALALLDQPEVKADTILNTPDPE